MAPPQTPRPNPGSTMSDPASTSIPAHATNGEAHAPNDHHHDQLPLSDSKPVSVNRKKQKRRQKQAARLAAERQFGNGHISADMSEQNGLSPTAPASHVSDEHDLDERANGETYYEEIHDATHDLDDHPPSLSNGQPGQQNATARKSKKKKGKKNRAGSQTMGDESSTPLSTPSVSMSQHLPPPLPPHLPHTLLKTGKDRSIWNTSTQEERENIKTFWLELGEEERRQLVKVEKDAVLKKMKEQQKHSCSCTVCGRKRTAIEEELEVLYDAYYEELEQYANNNQGSFEKGPPMVPPPRLYHPPLRSPGQHTRTQGQFHPSRGRIHELPEDDEDLEEDYDEDDEDDEPYSDDDYEDEETRAARADFFAFGNSLTVKDGILTVADDLLKNDGKHFIDMMEQLAERRMQREEDTQYGIAAAHQSLHGGHNHGPLDDDDYDEEEDEDYDSQEDEDYEEDEMVSSGNWPGGDAVQADSFLQDAMTEEQRMEEGRRMFQIFAARMFEQRVLTAYREKVAEQRQQKLIEELMEEQTRNEQRNAKKAREAQKRKDKKKLQKQAKEEEKARREAEKAAEEAAAKAEQEKKLEEQRRKREEQKKKREAERKAQEAERLRKEAEKQKRLREERERQAEIERKQREQKELEKKRREEARQNDLREKKTKDERERQVKDAQTRREAAPKTENEGQEKRDPQAKRVSHTGPVPIPASLQHAQALPAYLQSPHYQIATPIVPKAPTPARPRQPSQQGSHTSSPRSQPASTEPSQVSISPRSMAPSQSSGASSVTSKQGHGQPPLLHHPQPSTPLSPLGALNRSNPPGFSPSNPPGLGLVSRPPIGHELPSYPPHSGPLMNQLRGFPAPNGLPVLPSMNGTRPMPPGRGFPLDPGHGLAFHQQPITNAFAAQPSGLSHAHSRQPSSSFERSPLDAHAFPISRPSPIKRPSSTQQDQNNRSAQRDVDDLSAHLGSSALLDDSDVPFTSNLSQSLPGATAPGTFPGPTRASFAGTSLFADPLAAKHNGFPIGPSVGNTWSTQIPFGTSPFPSAPTWGTGPGSGWSNNAFAPGGHHRAHASRPVTIRLLVIQACKQLNMMSPSKGASGYHDVNVVLRQVNQLRPANEPPISLKEMLDICDTEGNTQNGGGSFSIRSDETGECVKFEPDTNSASSGHRGSIVPGEIGSPVPSSSLPAFGGIGSSTPSVLRQFSSPTGF
ncbi:stress response protein nst1 [Aspergillus tubingensis]|uniref:Stress response protein NST1 n=1 Tax=Aspergillus tubingensis TaxID=5068 RepID=A0A9W6EPD2_ASPTU|nr:stress response protein nst1 [Aspergillus tubingensis]GLA87298.1 stress response protein nst1 [Aspergillus tubingensis]GLA96901.1 stress response protein nst1 [Aspergillus tubingensis]